MGARFDAWTEHFRMDVWHEAFDRSGLDPEFYLHRSRSTDEVLPWDHIQSGVRKSYLKQEWERSLEGKGTPDCRRQCLECGVCDHKTIDPVLFDGWSPSPLLPKPSSKQGNQAVKKYRITFSKTGNARYLGHLELARLFVRAFKRADLNLVYSQGFHPKPRLSFGFALPVGVESMQETLDLQVHETLSISSAIEEINRQLPHTIRATHLENITGERKGLRLKESHFRITFNGLELDENHVAEFLRSHDFPMTKTGKKGKKRINARQQVKSMRLIPDYGVSMVITHTSGPELKASDIIKGVFHLTDHHMEHVKILKTGQVLDG